jgi:hypothetical protein
MLIKTFRKSWLCFSGSTLKEIEHKSEALQLIKEIMIRLKRKIFRLWLLSFKMRYESYANLKEKLAY